MKFQSDILYYILFLPGFYVLIKSANLLIEGSIVIARRFKVSDLVIALTIVSFGTSSPELAVNILSSIQGNSDIAISNILGSNLANILLILGISSLFQELVVQKTTTWKEIPFSLLGSVVLFFLANDIFFQSNTKDIISVNDGLILLCFFIIFLYYIYGIMKENQETHKELEAKNLSLLMASIYVIVGLLGLVIGGDWIVKGAVLIAKFFGFSESFIGLTIVAVGTSLPELATSAVAAYKGNSDIAVGNVVGSNIFNIFFILGITSVIKPIPFDMENQVDLIASLGSSILLFFFMFIGKKHRLEKKQGIIFLILYVFFLIYRAKIGGKI